MRVYDGATFGLLSSQLVYSSGYTGGVFVSAVPPSSLRFASPTAATFQVGNPGSFTVVTEGSPVATSIAVTGTLPSGLTFVNNGDGTATLSGTPSPSASGVHPLTFAATSGTGLQATQNFTLTVAQSPAITSPSSTTFTAGAAASFSIVAVGFPTPTLSATGAFPPGVTFADNGDGTATLSGTPSPSSSGVYPLTFTAANSTGPRRCGTSP